MEEKATRELARREEEEERALNKAKAESDEDHHHEGESRKERLFDKMCAIDQARYPQVTPHTGARGESPALDPPLCGMQ